MSLSGSGGSEAVEIGGVGGLDEDGKPTKEVGGVGDRMGRRRGVVYWLGCSSE